MIREAVVSWWRRVGETGEVRVWGAAWVAGSGVSVPLTCTGIGRGLGSVAGVG